MKTIRCAYSRFVVSDSLIEWVDNITDGLKTSLAQFAPKCFANT